MRYIAKTSGLFAFMIILFIGIGYLIGGFLLGSPIIGTLLFLGIAAALNLVTYFYSDKIILKAHRAEVIKESDNPRLYNIVRDIAFEADIKMPRIAIVPTDTPNAFATGRNENNAVVAATRGILRTLDDEELKGVISHEVAHIKDRDMLVMSIAATLAGAITIMARIVWFQMFFSRRRIHPVLLLAMIFAPIGALLIRLAISRKREFMADEQGAKISKNPNALARALEKLNAENRRNPIKSNSTTTASLFIVNPFKSSTFVKLFSTHPPVEERVKKLREMATDFSYL
ncbi:MAG: zinc metalloprotease HtpX [Thermoplasmatota archaeon]